MEEFFSKLISVPGVILSIVGMSNFDLPNIKDCINLLGQGTFCNAHKYVHIYIYIYIYINFS